MTWLLALAAPLTGLSLQLDGSSTLLIAVTLLGAVAIAATLASVLVVLRSLSRGVVVDVPFRLGRPVSEALPVSATPASRPRPRAPARLLPAG